MTLTFTLKLKNFCERAGPRREEGDKGWEEGEAYYMYPLSNPNIYNWNIIDHDVQ